MKGEVSSLIEMDLGTPQGSRLSPLLFVILMADLNLWIKGSFLSNFADDTQSIVIEESREAMIKKVKEESSEVLAFFSGVNLVNNPDKAALLQNSKRKHNSIEIEIGGEKLVSGETEKLLGMYVSSDLDWTVHVDMVCKALKQRLGILKKA